MFEFHITEQSKRMNTTFFYNQRIKSYIDENGEVHPYEVMTSAKDIFNPLEHKKHKEDIFEYVEHKTVQGLYQVTEAYKNITSAELKEIHKLLKEEKEKSAETIDKNKKRALRRAKTQIFDKILCNSECIYFITLTLNKEEICRTEVKTVINKMTNFLQNRVQRKGLKYIIVPELHKDGSIHFHGIINGVLDMVDSGTVIVPSYNKPIKNTTADMYNIPLEQRRKVYNIPEWQYGFTTAVKIIGDRKNIAKYITKYITKDTDKISGRYYYSSRNLLNPIVEYKQVNYIKEDGKEYIGQYNSIKYKNI